MVWAKWESLTIPKLFGGLGVRDLVSYNKALLGKWAWRAIQGGDLLWLDLVRDSRGRVGSWGLELLDTSFRGRGWWGDVIHSLSDRGVDWFSSVISRKLGDGKSTRFWVDVWAGESSLKSLFPRLFNLCLHQGCSVAEAGAWVDNRWVWHIGWRRVLRSWECESLSSLTDLLLCRKQVANVPDFWEWKLESNKCFSVRSAYNMLLDRKADSNAELKPICKLLCSNWAVPKAQATAWRILFRRIATRVELKRRGVLGVQSVPVCPVCNQADESVEHLFVECRRPAALWRSCLHWLGIYAPLLNNIPGNFLHFSFLGSSKRHRVFLVSLWVGLMWMIWKVRNEIIFNNGEWKHDKILGDIKSFMWNWSRGKGVHVDLGVNFQCWCSNPWSNSY